MSRTGLAALLLVTLLLVTRASPAHAEDRTPIDLAKVKGQELFPGGTAERNRLAQNGFVVLPRFHRQMFSVYIGSPLPHYITCDSAHRTYHVLFEEALALYEKRNARKLGAFVTRLFAEVAKTPESASGRNEALAHIAVSARLLGQNVEVLASLVAAVEGNVKLIEAAAGVGRCPLFGVSDDYALYKPRGLYEATPALQRYFRAMTWMARRGFRITDEAETWAAVWITRAISADQQLRTSHESMTRPLDWLVGAPDDLTCAEYESRLRPYFEGGVADLMAVGAKSIRGLLMTLPRAKINAAVATERHAHQGLRIFPSRRTPDGVFFQMLNDTVPGHRLPSGLEIAAALGSPRADALLRTQGKSKTADAIAPAGARLRKELADTHYGQSLAAAAILMQPRKPVVRDRRFDGLSYVVPVVPDGVMRSPAWQDRMLTAGLSGWASLRHAFTLHAKKTAFLASAADEAPGMVEPIPKYFDALAKLARSARDTLDKAGAFDSGDPKNAWRALLPMLEKPLAKWTQQDISKLQEHSELFEAFEAIDPDAASSRVTDKQFVARLRAWVDHDTPMQPVEMKVLASPLKRELFKLFDEYIELAERLAVIAQRHLDGKPLTEKDVVVVGRYGEISGPLNLFFGNSYMSADRQMGLIVDVGFDPQNGTYREVGVGAAMELYVVLPHSDGSRQLYRGATYSYYEFDSKEVLTDSVWQQNVKASNAGALPGWMSSFVVTSPVDDVIRGVKAGKQSSLVDGVFDVRVGRALLDQLSAVELPQQNKRHRYLRWLAKKLAKYGDSALQPEIVRIALQKLAPIQLSAHERLSYTDGAAKALVDLLALVAKDADHQAMLDLLPKQPLERTQDFPLNIARCLMLTHKDFADPFVAFLSHRDERLRFAAVDYLASRAKYGGDRGSVLIRALLSNLEGEPAVGVQHVTLASLSDGHDDRLHATQASSVYPLTRSTDHAVRQYAAKVLGLMKADVYAPRLIEMLDDKRERVVKAAAEALGAALRDSKRDDLRKAAAAALWKKYAASEWPVAVSTMHGFGTLGGPEAVAHLSKIAESTTNDVSVRAMAVRSFESVGELAKPTLYRLCFDEAKISRGVNGRDSMICDVAVEVLEVVTGGDQFFMMGDSEADLAVFKKHRDMARKLGYAPKGK